MRKNNDFRLFSAIGRSFGLFVCLAAVSLTVVSCNKTRLEKMEGFAQGSYYAVKYYTDEKELSALILQPAIDSILDAFDLCASLWNENSEICRVNRNEDFTPSAMFCDLFEKSQYISRLTDGAFDITVSPLVKRYGFSKEEEEKEEVSRNLSDEELKEIMSYVGYKKVRLVDGKIQKDNPDLQIDFNAIAQGYASGLISDFLESRGIHDYLVDVGGEICGKGTKPDGSTWIVGIERPAKNSTDERTVFQIMNLRDKALVTSGSYRKYFVEGGHRFSHTIDPKTGRPVRHKLLSATVLCDECWEADALATACMVWGIDTASAFLMRNTDRYQGFLIYGDPLVDMDSTVMRTWSTPDFPLNK